MKNSHLRTLSIFYTLPFALMLCLMLPLGCGGNGGGGGGDGSTTGVDGDATTGVDGDATTGVDGDATTGVDGDATTTGGDTYPDDCTVEPTFSSIQVNYFAVSCSFSSCHGNGGKQFGLTLDTEESFGSMINVAATHPGAAAKNKVLVVPGDAANSFLYQKLLGPAPDEGGIMPSGQKEPLGPDCQLRAVRDWINAGALDN
jgi:hypothetical protein